MSSLAQSAEVPFASAMRRIHKLIEIGEVEQQERAPGSKTFYVVPSKTMIENFIDYARKVKALLAETFGLKSGNDDEEDYYFGGSYLAGQIIPPLEIIESRNDTGQGPEIPAARRQLLRLDARHVVGFPCQALVAQEFHADAAAEAA